jgi:hypothetical protein
MRDCHTCGSARGARSNARPYRDLIPLRTYWVAPRMLSRISRRPESEGCYPRRTPQNSGYIDFTMPLMSERNAVG